MTVNKSDIINLVSEKNNLSLADTEYSIKKIIDYMGANMFEGNRIEIRGFGTFSKKYIRPRKFINPKTKEVSYLGETATMHFKPSKSLIKK